MAGAVVCLIPARGGSKGIPMKNLAPVAGKPLVAWSIERALASASVAGRVYVSSDDDEILRVSQKHGARAIKRPPELSIDTASSESALIHALGEIAAEVGEIEYVVFLQPTSPVRKSDDIENAVRQIRAEDADSLFSATPLKDFFLWGADPAAGARSLNFDYRNRKRRQDLETTYLENGSIYVFRPRILLEGGNRLGGKISIYEMDKAHSQQIDEREELELCEHFLKRYAAKDAK